MSSFKQITQNNKHCFWKSWGGGGGGSLSSNGEIDMNACKIYIVPLYVVKDCRCFLVLQDFLFIQIVYCVTGKCFRK